MHTVPESNYKLSVGVRLASRSGQHTFASSDKDVKCRDTGVFCHLDQQGSAQHSSSTREENMSPCKGFFKSVAIEHESSKS